MPAPQFDGLRVLALERRRAAEVATLIATYGGQPLVVPALQEVPLSSNTEALRFAAALLHGQVDMVVFLTGTGTRTLVRVIEAAYSREAIVEALARLKLVVRGPKPLAALRELGVPVWLIAPEPNTWREVLSALDARSAEQPLKGARIAVQEYGVSNTELLEALRTRGAHVTPVPVYVWALPEDIEPLKQAVRAICQGELDVVLFTTSVQIVHLWQVAGQMGLEGGLRQGFARLVTASIGPTTSEELRRHGLPPDLEASSGKLGVLVREAANASATLVHRKRTSEA